MDYKKLTKEIKTEIKKTLKKSRYEHSIRVAKMCKKICKRFNLDEEIGYFLGVAHDMCKYYSKEDLTNIVQSHGIEIIQIEKESKFKKLSPDNRDELAKKISDWWGEFHKKREAILGNRKAS